MIGVAHTLLTLLAAATLGAACALATAAPVSVDPRVEADVARGRSRALVELRIAGGVRPEGELSPERVAVQRQAISGAQDAVLEEGRELYDFSPARQERTRSALSRSTA